MLLSNVILLFRVLKDNHAGDGIEGDVPPLLCSILAQNPHVFRGNMYFRLF